MTATERYTEVCSAHTPRCPGCMTTLAGKDLRRIEYSLATCFNKRRGQNCAKQSLVIPLGGDRVQLVELSTDEAAQIRADERSSLEQLLRGLGVMRAARPLQRRHQN